MAAVTPIKPTTDLGELAALWMQAKAQETEAAKQRVEIENVMLTKIQHVEKGTVKEECGNAKISVTFGQTRAVDSRALETIWNDIPESIRARLFTFKPSVSEKEFTYLLDNEPELMPVLSKAVTSKPRKPSFKITIEEV